MAKVAEKQMSGGAPPVEIEDGTYPATVYAVKDDVWPAGDFGFGHKEEREAVTITFLVEDVIDPATGENVMLDAKYTLSLHENATLRRVAKALFGRDVSEMDTEEMVACRGLITVEHPTGDWPRVTNVSQMPKGM